MVICDTAMTVGPRLPGRPKSILIIFQKLHPFRKGPPTCIEEESSGASRSSLPILATFVCTLTNAFNSFDSSNCCRKSKSCSPDKLSASFNEDTNLERTVEWWGGHGGYLNSTDHWMQGLTRLQAIIHDCSHLVRMCSFLLHSCFQLTVVSVSFCSSSSHEWSLYVSPVLHN